MMSALHWNSLLITAILLWLLPVNPVSAFQSHSVHRRPPMREQPAPATAALPPPAPTTLEQMPATPPKVDFSNGRLTIVAENSTLGDILRAVSIQTGAMLEMSADASERVVTHLGPGPIRDVMATLINGSHFNYVLVGSSAQPDKIDRVILTPLDWGTTSGDMPPRANGDAIPIDISSAAPSTRIVQRPIDDGAETAANTVSEEDSQAAQPPANVPEQAPQGVAGERSGQPGPQ
jgi:hypothetical protein